MENNIFYKKEMRNFLEYSIFELESSNLFIYLFIWQTCVEATTLLWV
jgi:hypothetical protein